MANKQDFIASGPTKPDIAKSHFDLSYTNNLTANFGKIYPLGSWLMPAGSHFHCNCDYGFDLQPLVFPVQTNMRFHVKFYKAPLRILWKNWRNYVSRGGKGYEMPYINRSTNFYQTGSLSDYLGVPSFQSTSRQSNYVSRFYNVINIQGSALSLDDVYYYDTLNTDPINASFYAFTMAPIDGYKFSRLKSGTFTLTTNSSSNNLGSNSYIYLLTSIDDTDDRRVKHVKVLKAVKLTSDNCVINSSSPLSLTLSNNIFGDLSSFEVQTMFQQSHHLYVGVSSNYLNFFFQSYARLNDYPSFVVPEVLETTDQDGVKVPAHNITEVKVSHNRVFKLSFTSEYTIPESHATHFQSVNGATPKLPLLAFRWRMYEFIYNYFIRNERVTPFKLPDDNGVLQQVFNQYLTNDGDGADSTTPIEFKFAPYEYDLFTTCLKKPTFGDAPLVGVSFTYDMSGNTPTGEFTLLKEGEQTPSNYQVDLDGNGNLTGISHYSGDADSPTLHRLEELIEFGISINDLRNVSAYQRFLERMTKAGTKYENIMYEFFGTNPPTGEEFPSYLGGYTDLIRTDKVLNQSMAEGTKLGEYAGNAYLRSRGGKRQIRTFCQEDCYIMAVGWFSVTPTYSQKLDKDFVYTNLLDFVNPQFASVSPQPVYDYQIAPLEIDPNDDEALHHVFGYNRPFAEAVSRQDECHGLFRSNMQNFIMQRIFAGAPELGEDFLYMKPEDLSQIFAVTETTDKIFGQIHFDVNATLPLPHMAVPRQI